MREFKVSIYERSLKSLKTSMISVRHVMGEFKVSI